MEPKRQYKNIYEYELPNGLRVIYVLREGLEIATSNVTYHVGSMNEGLMVTGSTHFLEHLQFKGSKRFNKECKNGMWFLEGLGAQMNATTYLDRTNFYETIQSKYLNEVIPREADRMLQPLLTQESLESEMTVVRNELERGENNDFEVLHKRIVALAFMAHPYGHSTIGWKSDVENVSAKALRKFHDTYYIPNNATYTVVGNFDVKKVSKMVMDEFGKIPRGKQPPKMYTEEPLQMGQRRCVVKRPSSTSLMGIAFKGPHGLHRDAIVLKVLSAVFSAKKTNPFERLKQNGTVHDVFPSWERMKDPFLFTLWVTTNRASEEALETAEHAVFNSLRTVKFSTKQLSEAKQLIKNHWNDELQSTQKMAMAINEAVARGDAFDIYNRFDILETVTAKDLYRVTETLKVDQSTVGWFLPSKEAVSSQFTEESYQPGVYPKAPEIYNLGTNLKSSKLNFGNITKRVENGNYTFYPATEKTYLQVSIDSSLPHTPKNVMIKNIMCELMGKGVELGHSRFPEESIQNFFNENDIKRSIRPSSHGISLTSSTSSQDAEIVGQMVGLMKGEMYTPTLNEETFKYLKRKIMAEKAGGMGDVNEVASVLFSQALFTKNNPNYKFATTDLLSSGQNIYYGDLKQYHRLMFSEPSIKITAVSPNTDLLAKFTCLSTAKSITVPEAAPFIRSFNLNKHIDGKASCTVKWGHLTPKSLPLKLGIAALGGGFTGRLMQTVRDKYGLTYGIYARGVDVRGASIFAVQATFAPVKLEEGLRRSEEMIRDWAENGITQEELDAHKIEMEGSFDVQFDNTMNVVGALHGTLMDGKPVKSLDQHKEEIRRVTLREVNQAIKDYIKMDKMARVVVGSIKKLNI